MIVNSRTIKPFFIVATHHYEPRASTNLAPPRAHICRWKFFERPAPLRMRGTKGNLDEFVLKSFSYLHAKRDPPI